jgi:microcystin-dependent protein
MMARTAEYRDDIAGAIVTGGTSTAYTVTSFQVFDTLAHLNGQMIAFTPHATNTGTVTLNVDSLGAKPLRSAPNVELPSGSLILGTPYVATYNNSDAAFYLQGGNTNAYNIPLGGSMPYMGPTAPNSAFVLPYGQAISRTTYATLFALAGTTFGVGDGSTTFNVPDLRGNVPVGVDNMGGVSGGRFPGLNPGSQIGSITHVLTSNELPTHTHSGTTATESATHSHQYPAVTVQIGNGGTIQYTGGVLCPVGSSGAGGAFNATTETATHTHTITTDGGTVGGAAHNIMQPTLGMNYILRII